MSGASTNSVPVVGLSVDSVVMLLRYADYYGSTKIIMLVDLSCHVH